MPEDSEVVEKAVSKSNRKGHKGGGKYFYVEVAQEIKDKKVSATDPSSWQQRFGAQRSRAQSTHPCAN